MIVQEYLSGTLEYALLAHKYGIKSKTQLQHWVAAFKKFGLEGLSPKKNKEVYSDQFKLDVLSFMKRTGASVTETALEFGLTNPPIITFGTEALERPKGRPSMSDKAKNKKSKPRKPNSEPTREQELERENELLRLEVECLKKLRVFRWIRKAISKSTSSLIIRTQRKIPIKRCSTGSRHSRILLSLSCKQTKGSSSRCGT